MSVSKHISKTIDKVTNFQHMLPYYLLVYSTFVDVFTMATHCNANSASVQMLKLTHRGYLK